MATLFLIPAPLGDLPPDNWVIPAQRERIRHLTRFVVEASKTARKHLKQLELDTPLQVLELAELNEHTAEAELEALLAPLLAGHDVGGLFIAERLLMAVPYVFVDNPMSYLGGREVLTPGS